jgi:hypothetical protein
VESDQRLFPIARETIEANRSTLFGYDLLGQVAIGWGSSLRTYSKAVPRLRSGLGYARFWDRF